MASVTAQKSHTLQAVDHLRGGEVCERVQAERGIREKVDEDTAAAAGDERSERRFDHSADQSLDAVRHHVLDENARHRSPES
jgi:hypothetical protein